MNNEEKKRTILKVNKAETAYKIRFQMTYPTLLKTFMFCGFHSPVCKQEHEPLKILRTLYKLNTPCFDVYRLPTRHHVLPLSTAAHVMSSLR